MDNKYINDLENFDFCSFSNWLSTLNPYEFTLVATIIGFIISPSLTLNQQNSIGNFFELLGQVILTINAQGTTVTQKLKEKPGIKEFFEKTTIEEEIANLKKEVIKLREDTLNNKKLDE